MVEYEETSSLQVLGTVTVDATITVFFGLFSFDGTIHDALFPKGLFTTRLSAAATLLDVLVMLMVRATLAASAVTGTRQCTSRFGLFLVFSLHCAMAIWCDTDPTCTTDTICFVVFRSVTALPALLQLVSSCLFWVLWLMVTF